MSGMLVAALAVAGFVFLLVWACCAAGKRGDEAFDDVNEQIRLLQEVATSMSRTAGRDARLVKHRSEPIHLLLRDIPPVESEPTR